MTEKQFESEIRRLTRRARLLQAVQRGDVNLVRVKCERKKMRWTVNAKQRFYYRDIAPKGYR